MQLVRLQAAIFTGLAACFLLGGFLLTVVADMLSDQIYEPVLVESATANIADLRFAEAERDLLQALTATPEYAPIILDAAGSALVVMPELAHRLSETFALERTAGTPSALMREESVQGDFELGLAAEEAGAVDEALKHYEAAMASSDSHLQAAEAYLRLSGSRALDNAGAMAPSAQPSSIGNADR